MVRSMMSRLVFTLVLLNCALHVLTNLDNPSNQNPKETTPPNQDSKDIFPPNKNPKDTTLPPAEKQKSQFTEHLEKTGALISDGIKKIDTPATLKKLLVVNFQPIPSELKGLSNIQLRFYINALLLERRKLQRHIIYHMTQCWAAAIGSYFMSKGFEFPSLKMMGLEDDEYRNQLEEQWKTHQQRMADFVLEYIKVKKLKLKSLPENSMGIKYVKVTMEGNQFEYLPVYIMEKGEKLPQYATDISSSSSRILKTWWTT